MYDCATPTYQMYDTCAHAYEKLSLGTAGLLMGLALVALHGAALAKPEAACACLRKAHTAVKAGQFLLGVDFIWVIFLLLDAPWNPLKMDLFEFNGLRGILLLLCPILWFVLCSMCRENLFPRALGFFLLLLAIVPMSAAFLKEPLTRLLIPIWWYPVLTLAMFWVAKPYLFRDEAAWITARPRLFRWGNLAGLVYGAAIILCAIFFWY